MMDGSAAAELQIVGESEVEEFDPYAEVDKMIAEKYWAACKIEDIAGKIERKFDDYRQWLDKTGYADRIRTSYRRFYAIDNDGSLRVERDKDDVARIDVNHHKSIIRRMYIMVTENKLAYLPKARNSDAKSQIQTDIGRGACDYYGDEKDMNGFLSRSVLGTIVMLEQWLHCPWDDVEGYELSTDGGSVVKSGDQKFEVFSAFNCAHNTLGKDTPWTILKTRVNKYNLAKLHPEFAEEILNSTVKRDKTDMDYRQNQGSDEIYIDDPDYTDAYILYHDRTPALEEGRWTKICAGQVLRDGPLKYRRKPVVRMEGGDMVETCFADSPSIDILGLQQGLNALFSGAMTNGLNNAIQLLWSPDPNLTTRKLETGQVLVTSAQRPESLNLNGSNGEAREMIALALQSMQLLTGVNDVARGNPSANLKSGASLAVVLAQAIQYVTDIQKSYVRAAGDVATILINNLQTFGPEEQIAYIAGDNNKGRIHEFKKADIMDIERVTVDLGNPLMQSFAGRYEISQTWAERGIMKDPKQIEAFLRTGNLDQVTEDDFSDSLLIRQENEQIKRGENPPVLLLDTHAEHIIKHKAIFSTPEARKDPRIVNAGLAHIQTHIGMMREVPPDLAAIIAGLPLPPPPGAGGALPDQPNPTINGAGMPGLPNEAPPQVQENYQQALDAVPQQMPQQFN